MPYGLAVHEDRPARQVVLSISWCAGATRRLAAAERVSVAAGAAAGPARRRQRGGDSRCGRVPLVATCRSFRIKVSGNVRGPFLRPANRQTFASIRTQGAGYLFATRLATAGSKAVGHGRPVMAGCSIGGGRLHGGPARPPGSERCDRMIKDPQSTQAAGGAAEMLAAKPTYPIKSWRTLDSRSRRLLCSGRSRWRAPAFWQSR